MLLVDTNVLVDVLEDDPQWADWSVGQLRSQSKIHRLAINPIIYAELSLTFSTVEALDSAIEGLDLTMVEIPQAGLVPGRESFHPLPAAGWYQDQCAGRLLYWRARRSVWPHCLDPRYAPLRVVFSERGDGVAFED